MLLITSGAYVESELFSEFGKIPPCFLPVGNRRLLNYQIDRFYDCYRRIDLTIPHDFELDQDDALYLQAKGINVYRTEAGVTLGEAVLQYLDSTETEERIDILYGDTLISDKELHGTDWIAVGTTDEYYHWYHEVLRDGQPGGTWVGMFSFSKSHLLRRMLAEEHDFITAVRSYGRAVENMERKMVQGWLDFGHVHTYFDSKRTVTTQRHFNQLAITDGVLTKTSDDTKKMKAEAHWFETAPAAIKVYLPNFISKRGAEPNGYSLEYLPLAALNELYVFGRLPGRVWKKILSACNTYFTAASHVAIEEPLRDDYAEITYLTKTIERLKKFSEQANIRLDAQWMFNGTRTPSLLQMAHEAAENVMAKAVVPAFIHGDFCFSNILFDFRSGRIKVVDPRGIDAAGRITPYGDFRYEIGKLAHSVLGLYDFIVAGYFSLQLDNQAVRFKVQGDRAGYLQDIFKSMEFRGRVPADWDCYPVMLLLFLSMLPLHIDDARRQQALMANCLRIYLEWKHDHHSHGRQQQPLL